MNGETYLFWEEAVGAVKERNRASPSLNKRKKGRREKKKRGRKKKRKKKKTPRHLWVVWSRQGKNKGSTSRGEL